MAHVDEVVVHAWLDGALGAEEAARVAAHVEGCAACAARVAEARGLIAAASRILRALDDVPAGVLPARRRPVAWYRAWPVRLAASLVVAVVGSLFVVDRLHLHRSVAVERDSVIMEGVPVPRAEARKSDSGPASAPAPPVVASKEKVAPRARASNAPAGRPAAGAAAAVPSAAVPPAAAREDSPAASTFQSRIARAPTLSQVTVAGARSAAADSVGGRPGVDGAGCYDVANFTALHVPRRIVLDSVAVGDTNGVMRYAARVGPPESVSVAYWTAPARDSVEVVVPDRVTLAGRVTSRGLNGVAGGQPFTARRCPSR
jgi:hypothetical protein